MYHCGLKQQCLIERVQCRRLHLVLNYDFVQERLRVLKVIVVEKK